MSDIPTRLLTRVLSERTPFRTTKTLRPEGERFAEWAELTHGFYQRIDRATAVIADDVMAWHNGAISVRMSTSARCLAPFALTWVEYRWKNMLRGTLVERVEEANGRWRLDMWGCDGDTTPVMFFPVQARVTLTSEGRFEDPAQEDHEDAFQCRPVLDEKDWPGGMGSMMQLASDTAKVALMSFRFMNAVGIELADVRAPRHERRQAERSGQKLPEFKTLVVRGIKDASPASGVEGASEGTRALHLCRGHFADYTKGKGLFGKLKVEVFVPEHVRGNPDHGTVIKDYRPRPNVRVAGSGDNQE